MLITILGKSQSWADAGEAVAAMPPNSVAAMISLTILDLTGSS